MRKLIMMIGLPRSGKSTYAVFNRGNAVIVSADDFRQLMYGQRFYKLGEAMMWATRDICLRVLLQQGAEVIIDETNITSEGRAKLVRLAHEYGYTVEAVYVMTDADECKGRAVATGQDDLLPIIDRMDAQLETPTPLEGFVNILYIRDGAIERSITWKE